MQRSELEQSFIGHWKLLAKDLPFYEAEYTFHKPRRWRIDFAWPDHYVALELEGGVWINGGHNRGKGYISNLEKYNQLTLDGWRLLRFHGDQLDDDPVGCIAMLRQLLNE